jgi:hypothetical protein
LKRLLRFGLLLWIARWASVEAASHLARLRAKRSA